MGYLAGIRQQRWPAAAPAWQGEEPRSTLIPCELCINFTTHIYLHESVQVHGYQVLHYATWISGELCICFLQYNVGSSYLSVCSNIWHYKYGFSVIGFWYQHSSYVMPYRANHRNRIWMLASSASHGCSWRVGHAIFLDKLGHERHKIYKCAKWCSQKLGLYRFKVSKSFRVQY